MNMYSTYPQANLFFSQDWLDRAKSLGLTDDPFSFESWKGLKIARPRMGNLSDFELWPQSNDVEGSKPALKSKGADWVVYRNLLGEPQTHPGALVVPFSLSPYLDLTKPLNVKKEVAYHIQRTERKASRELGAVRIETYNDLNKHSWFTNWSAWKQSAGHMSPALFALHAKWVLDAPLSPWFRLLELKAGQQTLATGLFYSHQGVFYYYAPAMSPSAELRKYGGGKLLVAKLIEAAKNEGCHTFDFLQGAHDYKFHWNPEIRKLDQCIVPLSSKGKLALMAFRLKRRFSRPELHS